MLSPAPTGRISLLVQSVVQEANTALVGYCMKQVHVATALIVPKKHTIYIRNSIIIDLLVAS